MQRTGVSATHLPLPFGMRASRVSPKPLEKSMIKRIARSIRGILLKLKHFRSLRNDNPSALIQINDHKYTRYIYLLAKFLALEGYNIHIKAKAETFSRLYTSPYSKLLFLEKLIDSGVPENPDIIISERKLKTTAKRHFHLSADYFTTERSFSFRVPMTQHPLLYHLNLWDNPIPMGRKRINACIAYGNFDPRIYHEIRTDGLFDVCDRVTLKAYLAQHKIFHLVNSLQEIRDADLTGKVVIIDTAVAQLPIEHLRDTLAVFRYFLALPGAAMPQCHNIIEAMSTGTVPILEQSYADDMEPQIKEGESCLVYHGLEDIARVLGKAFEIPYERFKPLSRRVDALYNQYLTPQAVVTSIELSKANTILLQAEHESVAILKGRERECANGQ